MSRRLCFLLLFIGAVVGLGGVVIAITPDSLAADSHFEVVATGLDNPRGLDFGPGGALYIAEAGTGGDGNCISGPLGPTCYGATGAVTRVHSGNQKRVIEGLPSLSGQGSGGYFAFGPHDVTIQGRRAFVAIGLDATAADRDLLRKEGEGFAHLISVGRNGKIADVADLAAYEQANNSDGAMTSDGKPELRSNPHNVLVSRRGYQVIDSGANALLEVGRNGRVETLASFPARDVKIPGTDQTMPMQSVPTVVARGPEGALYVGELTGVPFPEGEARIYKIIPGRDPQVYLEGFTHIMDLAVDKKGTLYVLQIANTSLGTAFATGQLATGSVIRVTPDGARKVLASEGLTMPSGMTIGPDGYLYISNCGVCPGMGEVVRIPVNAKDDDGKSGRNGDNQDDRNKGGDGDHGDERDGKEGRKRGRQRN